MNSRIIKNGLTHLSVCLVAALTLASCASTNSREIAQEKANDSIFKNDVSRLQDSNQAPSKFHSKRFERNNEY